MDILNDVVNVKWDETQWTWGNYPYNWDEMPHRGNWTGNKDANPPNTVQYGKNRSEQKISDNRAGDNK